MMDQNSRDAGGSRRGSAGTDFVKRMAVGTVAAAGIVGALAMGSGTAGAGQPPSANVAMVEPMQPPIPPGPPVPPPMQEPGQEGPGSSIQDQPPGPAPAEPNENAICQDIMGLPDSGKMINPGCNDPRDTV